MAVRLLSPLPSDRINLSYMQRLPNGIPSKVPIDLCTVYIAPTEWLFSLPEWSYLFNRMVAYLYSECFVRENCNVVICL